MITRTQERRAYARARRDFRRSRRRLPSNPPSDGRGLLITTSVLGVLALVILTVGLCRMGG